MYYNDANEKIVYVNNGIYNGILDCMLAGTTYPNADYKMFRACSDVYVFEYVTKGKGYIETGSQKHTVTEGDFYFIKKGSHVFYYPDPQNPYEKIWINLDGSMIEDLAHTFRLEDVVISSTNVRHFFIEIHDLLSQLKAENTGVIMERISCLLFEMLFEIKRDDFFAPMKPKVSTAEAIKTYIDNNIYNNVSLDVMTDQFGITKMHIIRVFKKEYGTTPMQYLIEKKISIAKSLLSGTVMPIKEISALLQYSNTQHFSNTFKSAVGVSPNKYRQAKRNGM